MPASDIVRARNMPDETPRYGMFRIFVHIVSSEQTRDLRSKLVFRRPEQDWGTSSPASNSDANRSANS